MNAISIIVVPVTGFEQNASVVCCTETKRMAVVDPGGDLDRILAAAQQAGGTVDKIVLTHGHFDHAGAAAELAERLGVPVIGPHRDEKPLLDRLPESGAPFGFEARAVTPDQWLADGDTVTIGAVPFEVRHTPGHSPGHVVYINRPAKIVIGGDVLFAGSIGRTDLPGGDHPTLIASIERVFLTLPDDMVVLPGHGPATTIGRERNSNPFLVAA